MAGGCIVLGAGKLRGAYARVTKSRKARQKHMYFELGHPHGRSLVVETVAYEPGRDSAYAVDHWTLDLYQLRVLPDLRLAALFGPSRPLGWSIVVSRRSAATMVSWAGDLSIRQSYLAARCMIKRDTTPAARIAAGENARRRASFQQQFSSRPTAVRLPRLGDVAGGSELHHMGPSFHPTTAIESPTLRQCQQLAARLERPLLPKVGVLAGCSAAIGSDSRRGGVYALPALQPDNTDVRSGGILADSSYPSDHRAGVSALRARVRLPLVPELLDKPPRGQPFGRFLVASVRGIWTRNRSRFDSLAPLSERLLARAKSFHRARRVH